MSLSSSAHRGKAKGLTAFEESVAKEADQEAGQARDGEQHLRRSLS